MNNSRCTLVVPGKETFRHLASIREQSFPFQQGALALRDLRQDIFSGRIFSNMVRGFS
jgi:hypothetical protein